MTNIYIHFGFGNGSGGWRFPAANFQKFLRSIRTSSPESVAKIVSSRESGEAVPKKLQPSTNKNFWCLIEMAYHRQHKANIRALEGSATKFNVLCARFWIKLQRATTTMSRRCTQRNPHTKLYVKSVCKIRRAKFTRDFQIPHPLFRRSDVDLNFRSVTRTKQGHAQKLSI